MRSLYLAVKLRRFGVLVSSIVGTTGAETTRAGDVVGETASDPASGESGVCEGITMGSFSYALKCKLQPRGCLTLIGTEGLVNFATSYNLHRHLPTDTNHQLSKTPRSVCSAIPARQQEPGSLEPLRRREPVDPVGRPDAQNGRTSGACFDQLQHDRVN